ncbi:MAG: hypothetical protein R3304_07705 [Longimicrobiales bacterium]|nr:hypothetical protein [Longimicrobiales bacterium]
MPLRFLKLAMKARDLPEARVVGRVVLALLGVFVLWPVVSSLRDPAGLAPTDYVGIVVFTAVGGWLVGMAVRGWE